MAEPHSLIGENWNWGSEQVAAEAPPTVFCSLCVLVRMVDYLGTNNPLISVPHQYKISFLAYENPLCSQ